MQKPIMVLYINGNIMKRGGIEAFMMNYFRHIDPLNVHIDFLVHGYGKGEYDEEIEARGSKIYHVPTKSKHPIKYEIELRKIFTTGNYEIVHSHVDAMSCWILKIAKQCGIKIRIAHSHNTDHLTTNKLKYLANEYARKNICKYTTACFACSEAAGKWLFGTHEFQVIPNAIDLSQYEYSEETRKQIRKKMHIAENTIVLGHIGRFDTQKNHIFLIDAFHLTLQKKRNMILMLVGDGWKKEEIQKQIREYKIEDKVFFWGSRNDTFRLYSAMDGFVLPSLFEGLGIVLIEAQANGLDCYASDMVPREVNVTDTIHFLPLDKDIWSKKMGDIEIKPRNKNIDLLKQHGYDIVTAAKALENLYVEMSKKA